MSLYAVQRVSLVFAMYSSRARWAAFRSDSFFSSAHRAPLIGSLTPLRVFCQIFVGRFGVSFSPFERLFLGRFGFGQSCGLSVIA